MKKSLQTIEDYYIRKGLRGDDLRRALELDSEYRKILAERKSRLSKKFKIPKRDLKRFLLSTDADYEILGKIYSLKQEKLTVQDKEAVELMESQLELDWRKPLMKKLSRLLKKYR